MGIGRGSNEGAALPPVSVGLCMHRLGELLVVRGLITPTDLDAALSAQRQVGGLLGQTLVRMGALSERDLLTALSDQLSIPIATPDILPGPAAVTHAVERTRASLAWLIERDTVIWFAEVDGGERLHVASRHPHDVGLQEAVEHWDERPALLHLAGQQDLELLLEQLGKEHAANVVVEGDAARLRELAEEAPVIDFVNAMFAEANARRASDIHIEPFEDRLTVRFRIDGVLTAWRTAPRASFEAVASRIKLLSGMDIAERRLPQDGRQSVRIGGRDIDLRVSSLPAIWGESIVLRLLGKTRTLPELEALGVARDHRDMLDALIARPNGVVFVTGPTGSGKTTTIYRLLSKLNDGVRKIVTVEDPVEFELAGVVQMQVRADIGLSFAAGLRSILRQDPDVILVGEIRDAETARIAVQAALTGHLVVSTLHTNSALAAVPRLMDLGLEEYLLADVLRGIVGQRLVRRLCGHCSAPASAAEVETAEKSLRRAGHIAPTDGEPNYRTPVGCAQCGGAGYFGRIGIYEIVEIDAAMHEVIRRRGSEVELEQSARRGRFRSLMEDGLLKARRGETTVAEVVRAAAGQ